jgi:hypothetical protein
MRALLSAGVYLPRARLPRSSIAAGHAWFNPNLPKGGERSYAAWDEDSLTLAVEAVRACTASSAADGVTGIHGQFGALVIAEHFKITLVEALLQKTRKKEQKNMTRTVTQ